MNEGERFLRFCDELDQATARGLARSKRRGELIGWFCGQRDIKILEGLKMAKVKNVDRYIEAAANGEASPAMVLELAAELMATQKRLAAAEGIVRGFVSAGGLDQEVFLDAMDAAERFVGAESRQ
jgi:hypothetical protein